MKMSKKWAKIRCVMVGSCPNCGKEFVRPAECTTAACTCENPPPEIPLNPVVILPLKLYQRAKRIADKEGDMIENLIFRKGLKWILEGSYEKY